MGNSHVKDRVAEITERAMRGEIEREFLSHLDD